MCIVTIEICIDLIDVRRIEKLLRRTVIDTSPSARSFAAALKFMPLIRRYEFRIGSAEFEGVTPFFLDAVHFRATSALDSPPMLASNRVD